MNGNADLGLLSNGQVIVWANAYAPNQVNGNDCGIFGDGTTTTPATPTLQPVPLPSKAIALAAYSQDFGPCPTHACAILDTFDLYCWGNNDVGQSAVSGVPILQIVPPTKVVIPGVSKFASVATGMNFACATDGPPPGTGQVYCWGLDDFGQLGGGAYSNVGNPVPAAVQGINNSGASVPAAGVSAGDRHACAWLADGTVKCWGCNDIGQLGTGNYDDQPIAASVQGLTTSVKTVSAFADHTCAVYTDGTVACWGSSYYGQVGNGYTGYFPEPTQVAGLP
jgi:alpha-tubulin suppressor-like RCC1 family protein